VTQDYRGRWRAWAQLTIGGTDAQVDAATDAALSAVAEGKDAHGAAQAAFAAVGLSPPRGNRTLGGERAGATPRHETPLPQVRSVAAVLPPQIHGLGGRVTGMRQGFEPTGRGSEIVWNFRLERADVEGNALPPIPVVMRGRSIDGAINEGDWVEVDGNWQSGETLRIARAHNLTTGAAIRGKSGTNPIGNLLSFVFRLVVLVIFLAAVLMILNVLIQFPSF